MPEGILLVDDLRRISGLVQHSAIERWLRDQGIPYKSSRLGPWTTREAVNASMPGLTAAVARDDGYGAEVA
jgi:hypothetical protein